MTSGGEWGDSFARVPGIVSFNALLRADARCQHDDVCPVSGSLLLDPCQNFARAPRCAELPPEAEWLPFFSPFYFVAFKVKVTVEGRKKILLHLGLCVYDEKEHEAGNISLAGNSLMDPWRVLH